MLSKIYLKIFNLCLLIKSKKDREDLSLYTNNIVVQNHCNNKLYCNDKALFKVKI